MPDQPQSSKGDFPEECTALMKQLHHATLKGSFNRCMELQELTNLSLKKYGLQNYDYPIEYFQVLHQLVDPKITQDASKMEELGTRLVGFQQDAGMETPPVEQPPVEFEFPEEYTLLQKKVAWAFKMEDWPEFNRLIKEAEAILESMGVFNLGGFILEDEKPQHQQ